MRSTKQSAIRDRYIALQSTQPGSARYRLLEGTLAVRAERIQQARREVEETEAALHALLIRKRRARWRAKETEPPARAGREFDALVRHPDVMSVTVCGRRLSFTTVPVTIVRDGLAYVIGRFRITIRTDALEEPVRMVNLTRRVHEYYDHPFVYRGVPEDEALNNEHVAELLDRGRYLVLARRCLRFLKSYDESLVCVAIDNWPRARRSPRRTVDSPSVSRHSKRLRACRARYLTLRGVGLGSCYHSLLQQISAQREELDSVRAGLRTAEQRHAEVQAILDRWSNGGSNAARRAQIGIEFDRLCEHPDITRIQVWGGNISVWTRTIVLPLRGRRYKIGRFRITIPAAGHTSIRMVNLTRTVNGLEHPQGFTRFYGVCLGDLADDVQLLLREERNCAAVINLCLHFLNNWGSDARRESQYWSVVQ